MIVEIEEDSRDFTTVYKKDYLGEKGERPIGYRPLPKYRSPLNILNGPYKQYLNTRLENRSLPENERSEDPLDTLNRVSIKKLLIYKRLCSCVYFREIVHYQKYRYATSFPT